MNTRIKRKIDSIYKILGLYEDALNPEHVVQPQNYLTYIYHLAIMYQGLEQEEIYGLLNGIYKQGFEIEHDALKSIVFHLIDLVERDG